MRIVLLLSITFLTACAEDDLYPRSNFKLESGEIVSCRWIEEADCGVKLWDCNTGKKYQCLNNVEEL